MKQKHQIPTYILSFLFFCGVSITYAHTFNEGFEQTGANGFPGGWQSLVGDSDGNARIVEGLAHGGSRALRLSARWSHTSVQISQTMAHPDGGLPLSGAVTFWFQIVEAPKGRAKVKVSALDRNGKPLRSVEYFLPVVSEGDGIWHLGVLAYDFADLADAAKAAVSVEIQYFEPRPGFSAQTDFLVDDIAYAENYPAHFVPMGVQILEGGNPDKCEVKLFTMNTGGAKGSARVSISLPRGLSIEGSAEREVEIGADRGGTFSSLSGVTSWVVRGKRTNGSQMVLHFPGDSEHSEFSYSIPFKARLVIKEAAFSPGIVTPGDRCRLKAILQNQGHAWTSSGLEVELTPSSHLQILSSSRGKPFPLGPGQSIPIEWYVQALTQEGEGTVRIAVRGEEDSSLNPSRCADLWISSATAALKRREGKDLKKIRSGDLVFSTVAADHAYGPFALDLVGKGKRPLGRLGMGPYLGRVVWRDGTGRVERVLRCRDSFSSSLRELHFTDEWRDADGVAWKAAISLRPSDHASMIDVVATLTTSADRNLLAFEGPVLLAGEGSFGAAKDFAQFGGVEWLDKGEWSSDRSTIPELTDHTVPHPNRVTVPVMGIVKDTRMVGIMWQPSQLWDGENDRPSAFFSSPNQLDGQDNHLMGLFLPSIPKWTLENQREAAKPYSLRAARPITLRFSFVAAGESDALTPIRMWYATHGIPDPPVPNRSYEDEIALCRLSPNPQVHLLDGLERTLESAQIARKTQQRDGSWEYRMSPRALACLLNYSHAGDFRPYGRDGDTASGMSTTTEVSDLIRAARLTGDPLLREAALRGLKRLTAFHRPEGAQTWEQPLHTPDLLAAAQAVTAFVEAYRLTGDDEWLKHARWWAWSGLPFVYVWGAPDSPHMKYAAIAFLGDSYLDLPLLGQPVSWVGLFYAEALIELANYDLSFQWKKVAEGMITCVMRLHMSDGEHAGQWPDWWDVVTGRFLDAGWYDSPRIGQLLQKLNGQRPVPETCALRVHGAEIRVTSDGKVNSAQYHRGSLTFRVKPWPQAACQILVAGLQAPASVETKANLTTGYERINTQYDTRYKLTRFTVPVAGETSEIEVRVVAGIR